MEFSIHLKKIEVAGEEGLEPPTVGFGDRRSTSWNYSPAKW